ncbi:MAG: hypothetical protein QGI64_05205 [Desulfobacterales bacterium]|nr:hypothetical protein [Desulfobacterales bacterium]
MINRKTDQNKLFSLLILMVVFLFLLSGFTPVKTITLPLTIDYPLLRSLVIYNAFTEPDQTVAVLNENDGCIYVVLSEPNFFEESSQIRFETKVQVSVGTPVKEKCFMPIKWEGYAVFFQKPKIDSQTMILSFDTMDSILYNKHRKPAKIVGVVWELVKTWAYDYLDSISVNLAPPLSELKSFLLPLFPEDTRGQAEKMLSSLRPERVLVTPDAVQINIDVNVEEIYETPEDLEPLPISDEELEAITEAWEFWDAFLVSIITSLVKEPLLENDRQILFDTLLETRYRFITELSERTLERDLVREQFVMAWKNLSTIFRMHLGNEVSKYTLGYLAFFTASDALTAFDELGPTLGIEISRNGLIRLAGLLSKDKPVLFDYDTNVDTDLRKILDLGAPLVTSTPAYGPDELDLDKTGYNKNDGNHLWYGLKQFLAAPAWAKTPNSEIEFRDIVKWLVLKDDLDTYMKRVKQLLKSSTSNLLKRNKLPEKYHQIFLEIIFSTAWQESCFQQFKVKKGKITYLRSYNKTSIGLMQVNERVWRGIYNLKHLKWNIRYNAMAGGEIIDLYFQRYALKKLKIKGPIDSDTLAGVTYAMYNGGPRHFYQFLKRKEQGKYYLSDRLFFKKYRWVQNDQWAYIDDCLVGW